MDCRICDGTGKRVVAVDFDGTTEYGTCHNCKGSGDEPLKQCNRCKGEGHLLQEDIIGLHVKECPECKGEGSYMMIVNDKPHRMTCPICNGMKKVTPYTEELRMLTE